jgi:YegS/Rv2252/BmrU family lipid kinase
MQSVESVTVLINPAAASHQAKHSWATVAPLFEELFSGRDCTTVATKSREHTIEIAATATTDLIIVVGGDGTVHDVLQGLMQRPREERPALSIVPIGSGNDYAKTLGIPEDSRRALEAISGGRRASIDVGRCNEHFFLETLSFGVDAAIAFKTEEARLTNKSRGFRLYAGAAIGVILKELKAHAVRLTSDTGKTIEDDLLICAIQIGQTYGGGFIVAPKAVTNDGLLDICLGAKMSVPNALYHMALLARGKHENSPKFRTFKAQSVIVDLEEEIPTQFDGEFLTGKHFEIECLQNAIDVLVPQNSKL